MVSPSASDLHWARLDADRKHREAVELEIHGPWVIVCFGNADQDGMRRQQVENFRRYGHHHSPEPVYVCYFPIWRLCEMELHLVSIRQWGRVKGE